MKNIMRETPRVTVLCWLMACTAIALPLAPEALVFDAQIPGSNNSPGGPYTDDVLLQSMTFGGVEFEADSGQFVPVVSAYVSGGRPNINAERGDDDDGADGNPDPFTRVGLDPADYESTDPSFQDLALASAFSTLSLVEGTDGEGGGSTFSMVFPSGILDSSPDDDPFPEVVLFERGNNDTSSVRAIVGGTYDNPVYAPTTVTFGAGDMWGTGIEINTFEIGGAQELGAIGFDLSDFGVSGPVYGFEITTTGGDFYGQMLSAEDPQNQLVPGNPGLFNPNGTVFAPEPVGLPALVLLVSAVGLYHRKR